MDVITDLPRRRGPRPTTTSTFPHRQLDQQPDDQGVHDALIERAFALAGVVERDTIISVPGARALVLDDYRSAGPDAAFIRGREFAHFTPDRTGASISRCRTRRPTWPSSAAGPSCTSSRGRSSSQGRS